MLLLSSSFMAMKTAFFFSFFFFFFSFLEIDQELDLDQLQTLGKKFYILDNGFK